MRSNYSLFRRCLSIARELRAKAAMSRAGVEVPVKNGSSDTDYTVGSCLELIVQTQGDNVQFAV